MIELAYLDPGLEVVVFGEDVQELGELPGKALGRPDATQRHVRITREIAVVAFTKMRHERTLEVEDVGDRQVQAFRSGRRNDMGGVAGKKKPAISHRLRHEASQRGDRLFDR